MKKQLMWTAAFACTAAMLLAAYGCAAKDKTPMGTPSPSGTALTTANPTQTEALRPTGTPETTARDSAVPSVDTTAGASPLGDEISGFMEGGIVDPDDVPDIAAIFTEGEDYAGTEIQSITYKLYEGRQAYYVVLQGTGDERRFYVLPDLSVIPADAPIPSGD